jgi:excisionase family DNA binding protein
MTVQERQYLTASDVTRLLRIDKSTVYRMAEDGRLPGVKVGRQWRFPADEVQRVLGIDLVVDTDSPAEASTIDLDRAAALTGLFADLYGVMAVVTDLDGRPLTEVINRSDYFTVLSENPGVLDTCIAEWGSRAADQDFQPTLQPSQFGFRCARAFIRSRFELVGMVIAGGIAAKDWPPSPAELDRLAAGAGVDTIELAATIDSVPRLSEQATSSMLAALSVLARHLSADLSETRSKQ